MSRLGGPTRHSTPGNPLIEHLAQPIPTSEHVLLCSFGTIDGERTSQQLRAVLRRTGFPAAATGT